MNLTARLHFLPALFAAATLSLFPAVPASANLFYEITGTGELVIDGEIFGETGTQLFTMKLSYDPSLNTNTHYIPEGDPIGFNTAGNDFYGYSASGVLDLAFTLGTTSLPLGDATFSPRSLTAGISADIWMDTHITQQTPNYVLFLVDFDDGDAELNFGRTLGSFGEVFFQNTVSIELEDRDDAFGAYDQIDMAIIPEPSYIGLLLGIAVLILLLSRRRETSTAC